MKRKWNFVQCLKSGKFVGRTLPENGEKCVWKDRKGNIGIAIYNYGRFYDYLLFEFGSGIMSKDDVIAWRKLRPYPERLKYLTDAEIRKHIIEQYYTPLPLLLLPEELIGPAVWQAFEKAMESVTCLKRSLNQIYGVPKEEEV